MWHFNTDKQPFGLDRKTAAGLIVLYVTATCLEALGIGIFLPIFQYIRLEGDTAAIAQNSQLWSMVIHGAEQLGFVITLPLLLAAAFGCFLAKQVFTYSRIIAEAYVREGMAKRTRDEMFRHYMAADAAYHDRVPVGDLLNAVTTEVAAAVLTVMAPLALVSYGVMALVYLAMLASLSLPMTVASLGVIGFGVFAIRDWVRRSSAVGRGMSQANTEMSTFLTERFRSPRLVRLSGMEVAEQTEMVARTARLREFRLTANALKGRTEVVLDPIMVAASCVFLYISHTYFGMQIEQIGLYIVVAMRLIPIVKSLVQQRQSVLQGRGAVEVVLNRLESMERAREKHLGTKPFTVLNQEIRFDAVAFRYDGSEAPALNGVDLVIPCRKMTALVGPSGSGKSTLIDLLPKLRRPLSGAILFDGVPVEDLRIEDLRKGIAYAPQSPQIFGGTIGEHIRYGKSDATEEEIRWAASIAGAISFIDRLPDRFETKVGEGGVRLSGGQRQRLDLARAIVRRAPILVLDEPTSNLDAESEAAFRDALGHIRHQTDMTVIIVGHRLSTVAAADQIAVIEGGRVTELGTHAELMARDGWYRRAQDIQRGETTDLALPKDVPANATF